MTYTHKARVLAALRGETVDRLALRSAARPLVSRQLGLRHPAGAARRIRDERDRPGGRLGGCLRFADDQLDPAVQPMYLHRGIGLYGSRDTLLRLRLSAADGEIRVQRTGGRQRVEYHTPLGMVSATVKHYDREGTQKLGITIPTIVEHLIKSPADYAPAGWLFENLDVVPRLRALQALVGPRRCGDDGVPVGLGFFGGLAGATNPARSDRFDAVLLPLQGPPGTA